MDLGAFSVSLAVKDLEASRLFYQKLGFEVVGGQQAEMWLILRNGKHTIGLFQGMFDGNLLTFNPGWDDKGENTADFTDIRTLAVDLKAQGVEATSTSLPGDSGPGSITLKDPDGNTILLDQHR